MLNPDQDPYSKYGSGSNFEKKLERDNNLKNDLFHIFSQEKGTILSVSAVKNKLCGPKIFEHVTFFLKMWNPEPQDPDSDLKLVLNAGYGL